MNRKIFVGLLITFFALAIGTIAIGTFVRNQHATTFDGFTIGILQTASHPALDAARLGFQDELSKQLGKQIHFVIKNAQGSIANAHTIAQLFAANSTIDGILAIGTPAAQAIAHVEHVKPIFITAITDPVGLGLIKPKGNICGSSDMVDSTRTAQLTIALVPQARTAAILFCTNEASSALMANELHIQLTKNHIESIKIGITQETELPAAINRACTNADIIITPIDNMIASTITFIAQQAKHAKKPLIVSDNLLVTKGALAATGVDYTIAGQQAAQCASKVLTQHAQPSSIPIMFQPGTITINQHVLNHLGLHIPDNLKTLATIITGE